MTILLPSPTLGPGWMVVERNRSNDPIAGLHLTTQPRLGLVRHTPERPV